MAGEMGDHHQGLGFDDQRGDLYFFIEPAGDRHIDFLITGQTVSHDQRGLRVFKTETVALGQFDMTDGVGAQAAVQGGRVGQKWLGIFLFNQPGHHGKIQRPDITLGVLLTEMCFKGHQVPVFDKSEPIVSNDGLFKFFANQLIGFEIGDRDKKNIFFHGLPCS
jgi:hypothetical protein